MGVKNKMDREDRKMRREMIKDFGIDEVEEDDELIKELKWEMSDSAQANRIEEKLDEIFKKT